MKLKVAEQIFTILDQNNPNPTTELIYKTPFQLLIAVILSAQATDVSVNKACKELFELAETAEKLIQLGEIKLKSKRIRVFQSFLQKSLILLQQNTNFKGLRAPTSDLESHVYS